VICLLCHTDVHPHGLGSHQAGNACRVKVVKRHYAERDWEALPINVARLLDRADVPHKVDLASWFPGSCDKAGKLTRACYAPKWVTQIARLKIGSKLRVYLLKRTKAEPQARLAIEAVLMTNDLAALVSFVRQQTARTAPVEEVQ